MPDNYIHISRLGTYVPKHRTYNAYLMTHLALNGDFATSYLCAINFCRMSKGVLFIRDICNHQGTHIYKSAGVNDTTFNLIHDFNCIRRQNSAIAAWGTWKKAIITVCDESKVKLRSLLQQWKLDDDKYITSWQ